MGKIIQVLSTCEPHESCEHLYVSVNHVRHVEYAEPQTFKSAKKAKKQVIKLDSKGKPVFSDAVFGGQRVPFIEEVSVPVGIESIEEARSMWRLTKADKVQISEDGMTVTVERKLTNAYDEYLYTFDDVDLMLSWVEARFDAVAVKRVFKNPYGSGALWSFADEPVEY